MQFRSALVAGILLGGGGAVLRSAVMLSPLFSDHAVLQRGKEVALWGMADPGEQVSVRISGRSAATVADGRGHWALRLPPFAANSVGADLVASGKNTVTIHDLLVGEVWLCSGQSNMEMVLKDSVFGTYQVEDADREIAAAHYPLIRQFTVRNRSAAAPADTVIGSWAVCSPQTAGVFSAVGYFFARDLFRRLGVPVGIVDSAWGGTPIEAWMSRDALAGDPAFAVVGQRWSQAAATDPAAAARPREGGAYGRFLVEKAAVAAGRPAIPPAAGEEGRLPPDLGNSDLPSGLFNGMIHPLKGFALRGFLWYQGERNAERHSEYRRLFAALISSWRRDFGQGDLPFYWVQLANFHKPKDLSGQDWAFLREAQTETLALPQTGQAVIIDIGDPRRIHPKNKQEVGRRLGLIAAAQTYGLNVDYSGPIFAGATREGDALRLRFKFADGGLRLTDSGRSFELAGADRKFHPGAATLDGDRLVVRSSAVPDPVAVRYAWSDAPEATLFNHAQLPAAPFRSDSW